MKIDNITTLYESHPFVRRQNQEFGLMELPYQRQALEPHMSRDTIDLHYGKHHQTYVDNLNKFMVDKDYANMNLRDIVKTSNERNDRAVFNNAAQNLNHVIFWNCMSPDKIEITKEVSEALGQNFDSIEKAREKLSQYVNTVSKSSFTCFLDDINSISCIFKDFSKIMLSANN